MKKRQLAFDQLENRDLLCAAFGDLVSSLATAADPSLPDEGGKASDRANQVGKYKSGGFKETGAETVGEAVANAKADLEC